ATCDGMLFRGKTVAVVGGGNSAAEDALFLSKICKKVFLIHRRDSLRASKSYIDALSKAENITFIWDSAVTEFLFDKHITGIKVNNIKTRQLSTLSCDGVFVAVGRIPNTELFRDALAADNAGYLVADETTRTALPGVFAVGDIRTKPLRQIITAAADGAVASKYAEEYIASL
ncbi:MAG: FAD-dependent oxidoreductase, partial [Oscillospiraceae bacterium]|nr:FAD-dependent oxidoreductase [Oscillospiraceae bacterium]